MKEMVLLMSLISSLCEIAICITDQEQELQALYLGFAGNFRRTASAVYAQQYLWLNAGDRFPLYRLIRRRF